MSAIDKAGGLSSFHAENSREFEEQRAGGTK
jgi:hypothetical protein